MNASIYSDIRAVVFDLDGTLYNQFLLRICMMAALSLNVHKPGFFTSIRILKDFRRERERLSCQGLENRIELQLERLAASFEMTVEEVEELVSLWMDKRPLRYLPWLAFPAAKQLFKVLRERGIRIAVLSDLPIGQKLAALAMAPDIAMCTQDFLEFKPGTKSLMHILRTYEVTPEQTLVVGDRDERDGAMARAVGSPFFYARRNKDFVHLLYLFTDGEGLDWRR